MFDTLEKWDIELFFAINSRHNAFFDFVFYWLSNGLTWIPVYALLVYFLIKTNGIKPALIQTAVIIFTVAAADLISVYCFKNVFERYRPSHNLLYGNMVHIVNDHKGGIFGFVSSHAVNFAVWTTMCYSFFKQNISSKWLLLFLILPIVIGFTRIYLGVHYPGDVVVGYLIGLSMAILALATYRKFSKL